MGLQDVWGPLIPWYLFLAGTGAGAYLIGVIASFCGERYRFLIKPGVFLGAPLVAIGAVLLITDLGVPERFMYVFLQPQTSMMSIGVIIVSGFIVFSFIHLVILLFSKKDPRRTFLRVLGVFGGIFAVATAVYTGLLLGVLRAIPFWNNPLLPVLFLFSALSTGVGAVFVTVGIWRWIRPAKVKEVEENAIGSVHALGRIDIIIIIIESITLFAMMFIMMSSSPVEVYSAEYLLTGEYALPFWLGLVVVGLLVPIILEIWTSVISHKKLGMERLLDVGVITGICLLIGGVVLRYSVVAAGASISISMLS